MQATQAAFAEAAHANGYQLVPGSALADLLRSPSREAARVMKLGLQRGRAFRPHA